MTEEEAKTKRRPHGAGEIALIEGHDYDGPRLRVFGSNCIGSACAVWLADEPLRPTRVHEGVLKDHWKGWTIREGESPDAKGYVLIDPPLDYVRYGMCGSIGNRADG